MRNFKRVSLIVATSLSLVTGIGGCSTLVDQLADIEVAPAPETADPAITDVVIDSDYLDRLRSLTIAEPVDNGDYYRTGQFGKAWLDLDNDDCSEREEVLARDLTDTEFYYEDGWCTIGWGTLHDPYTDEIILFEKGQDTSALVQIDHKVPLYYAWIHGADKWTQEKRIQFANDLDNLIAVKGSANSSKGGRGPAEWIPPNEAYWCTYAEDFIQMVHKYGISVSSADSLQLEAMLSTCTL